MAVSNRRPLRASVRAILGRTIVGLASASAVALSASAQEAQQQAAQATSAGTQDGTVEEVVVTGYRQSLVLALDQKREAVGSVDAIVAEDIADFPDLNLAESIQRIPGVSIQRDAGEGRQITVRGLGPEFTRVRLNGMEAMSANGGTDAAGGTNRARNFDFNTFASELFNSITVRKTASADVEEGSLGATVDLRTGRPLDYDGFTVVTSVQAGYNDLVDEFDPRGAVLLSNTWAEGTLGALVSVAYTERKLVDEGSSAVRWARPSANGGGFTAAAGSGISAAQLTQINNAFVPRIPRYDYYEHDQDRLGVTASLQFAPSDNTALNLDVLYAEFNAERSEIFLEIPNFSAATNGMQVANAVIDGNNTIVAGTFNNVDIRTEQRFDELKTEFTQFTLDGSQQLTDSLKLVGLVGYAKSDHTNPVQTTLLFDWNNVPTVSYDYRGNDRLPVISYGATNLTSNVNGTPQTGATSTVNSNGWYLSQIRLRPQTAVNEFMNYQAELQWELSDVWSFKAGAQLKQFEFETTELRRDPASCTPALAANANAEGCISTAQRNTPISSYSRVFSFGSDLGIPGGSNTSFLIPDLDAAARAFGLNDRSQFPLSSAPALNNNRTIEEDDTGAFVQADMNTEVAGLPLRGNLGVRYVQTDQTSTGFSFLSGQAVTITADRDYSDTLPSLNLALNVTDEIILRASAAKVMSRPALGALTPGGTVNVTGNNRTATLGNPNIDPTRAKAYDLGVEWYFASESLLSLALFYKDIESRPQQLNLSGQTFTGNPFGIPDSVAVAACGSLPNCAPNLPIWTFNTTVNGKGGELKGFEISYQQPFTFLPGFFSNFGAILNYTGVDSEIDYINPVTGGTDKADLTGLSNSAYNATLYYETTRFGARVSAAYRDEYLDPINGAPGRDGNNLEGVEEVLTIDASARLTVNDMIDVTLEALNLTDEFQDQWVDQDANRSSFYHHTGRSYLLGARIKF